MEEEREIDIYQIIEYIDANIANSKDDDLLSFAKILVGMIYDNEDIEDTASYVVNHLAQKSKNAGLKAENGVNVKLNDLLYNRYYSLMMFVFEKTQNLIYSLDPRIFNYWDIFQPLFKQSNNTIEPQTPNPKPQTPNLKPQQKSHKPARGKGRPKETLKDKMINDIDGSKLQKVHTVMNGKKGKDAALIILACIKKGWMPKPTFTQVTKEFGNIGAQQGFTKYLNESWFTKDEIEGAINSLD